MEIDELKEKKISLNKKIAIIETMRAEMGEKMLRGEIPYDGRYVRRLRKSFECGDRLSRQLRNVYEELTPLENEIFFARKSEEECFDIIDALVGTAHTRAFETISKNMPGGKEIEGDP